MHRSIWQRIEEILRKHVLHGKWTRAVIALACAVIFITTYVLIMPAVTLSRAADCGQEEHTHTEDCYETETEFTCSQEEHTHTEDCYDEEGNLICGMEEHVHDDSCYTSREVLVCGQEEHVHTEDCYAEEEAVQEDIPEEAEEAVSENEEEQSEQPQAGDTVMEQAGTAAPEQLSQIRFRDYLTDWTTLYYAPEDGDNWQPLAEDKWHPLYEDNWGIRRSDTADRGLDPEEYVLLHIGYRIPAGQINATNPEAEFILPLSVRMTEEEVRDNNNNNNTLFRGTDREADELFVDGEYEIKEEWNSDGEVTQRKLVITFNEDACLRCGGEKLTDGTETLAAEELEGFFELRVKAEDLLTLEKKSESVYVLEWNDEEDLDTIIRFDPEKLTAYYGTENADDAEAETEGPVSGELRAEGKDYTITVSYTEEAGLPADVSLKVKEITRKKEYESYKAQMEEELIDPESTKVTGARFFDITLEDSEGNELHPESGVRVLIETKDTLQENEKVQICHFDEEKDKPAEVESREVTGKTYEEENLGVEFEAESFSVYGVVYTVDFEYSVNGKMYQFSLPGGGFVSFADLIEVLGIIGDTNFGENGDENGSVIADNAEENAVNEGAEENGVNADTNAPLTLGDMEVSEATRKFVADVASVEFSSPELVDVSKVEGETTVGQIKDSRGLECEYSAELTEEQIAEINEQTVDAGDWALISVQPFTSEETLTVTMKDGEVFKIRVTDYQISTNVLTADGKTYKITVTYDDDAEIPEGTKLIASEIEPGTDEYIQHLGQVWTEVNKEYFEVEEKRENYDESMGELPDVPYTNINTARFFDVSLIYNNEEIEPKAPVQVEISYVQGLEAWEETTPGVAHYVSGTQVEIIEDVETTIQDNEVTSFRYEQESFSGVGTYVGQEIQDSYVEPKLAAAPDPNGSAKVKSANMTNEVLDEVVRSSLKSSDLLRAGETEQSDENDNTGIQKPEAHKSLSPNEGEDGIEDGTYTLTLSVKGHSSVTTETTIKKSNVLVVMDRSSSMITKTVSDESTRWYYGTKATSSWRGDLTEGNGYHFIGVVNGQEVDLIVSYDWRDGGSWDNPVITYQSGTDWWGNPQYSTYPDTSPIYVVSKKTRMTAEQEALSTLFTQLMEKNDASGDNKDIVEISVISFGDERFDDKSWADETEIGWQSGRDTSSLMGVVNSNRFTSGTNWEEALQYAYEVISTKKTAEENAGKTNEDYYVIFLTDGEPTAVEGDSGAAYHTTDPITGEITKGQGNIYAYEESKDDAEALVNAGFKFYNIFTFRTTEDEKYSIYLTNYAYGNGNQNEDTSTSAIQNYYEDAQTIESLTGKFNDIFNTIEDSIGHGNVSITDTLTTDAMTTTVVQGKTNGYVYTVTDPSGNTLYTVTATGNLSNPTVTFHVPGSTTEDYTATAATVGGKTVYNVTTEEGKEYKMALADINDTTGQLVWDLSPVGLLLDGCTYSVSFIVWPDQDAYDYVAALNNSLDGYTWNTSAATYEDLRSTKGYEKGGVERYPSIVKKSDGTFAVLTNTDQQLHYSVIETTTTNGTTSTEITGPFYHDLELPDPMPLTASDSQIEKVWNISRDPDILAQLLYGDPENHYSIGFDILQDDNTTKYTSVGLGWDKDANNGEGAYIWKSEDEDIIYVKWDDDQNKYVRCSQGDEGALEIGTHWTGDFSIATGLMLSETRMNALGLDKSAYTWTEYPAGGTKYYLLEEGHDYTISEPNVGYEFDFDAPVYHPMLVDGVLTNVELKNVVKDSNGNITSYNITGMTSLNVEADGTSALTVANTLRGYLNVEKRVMDNNGNENPSDDTEFEFTITVSNDDGLFEGDHIPWFAVNDCFYHTVDGEGKWHYYQVDKVSVSDGVTTWRVITEKGSSGPTYTFTSNTFNPDIPDKQMITCTNVNDANDTIVLELYGNPTTPEPIDSNKKVKLTRSIRQDQKLTIGNVPAGSEYTVEESGKYGYELKTTSGNTSGTIAPNSDTNVIFTNKKISTDVDIQKKKETGEGLSGAIFQLRAMSNGAEVLAPVEIGGIDNITKEINGEQQEFKSAFETTDEIHSLTNLPDGTYRLYEVYVPAGYINTLSCIEFAVSNGTVTCSMAEDEEKVDFNDTGTISLITITNTTGAALPNTGGPGTTGLYLLGIMLTGLAGAGLVMRKRRRGAA